MLSFTRVLQRQMIHVPLGVNVKIKQAPETWFKNNCGGFFDPRPFTLDPRLVTPDPRPFTLHPRPKGKLEIGMCIIVSSTRPM